MLKRLARALKFGKFNKDQRGSVKIMLAVTTPLLLVAAGAGIDTAELYRAKTNFQSAVDAAALMAAKTLAATGNTSKATSAGEELFYSNIRNITEDLSDANVTFDLGNGDCVSNPIVANATLRKQVFFAKLRASSFKGGKLLSPQEAAAEDERVLMQASSQVQCGNDTIEIALVLDNSGSMRHSGKIQTLRSAASNLVNTLHTTMGQSGIPDPLKFSVVPFATMVNVGSNNRNASWMDTDGINPTHHENLNWTKMPGVTQVGNAFRNTSGQAMTRFTLYDQLPGIDWKGCVEERPYPHNVRDTAATSSTPESLIVPSFSPDTPDNWTGQDEQITQIGSNKARCVRFERWFYRQGGRWARRTIRRCDLWSDGHRGQVHPREAGYRPHWDDRIQYNRGNWMGNTTTVTWVPGNVISEERYQNNYLEDDHNYTITDTDHPRSRENTGTSTDPDTGQWGRQKWASKYFNNPKPRDVNNNRSGLPSVLGAQGGPNSFCEAQPITDLTTNKGQVISALATMQASGSTNVQEGVAWGWRTLSEDQPFTNGRPYSAENNKKIMIVMTDGNNTAYPIDIFYSGYSRNNRSYYNAFGHSANGRIFDGFDDIANPTHDYNTFRQAIDHHLTETCQNVKAAGITVYSIAFDIPNGSSVKTMMENCASQETGGGKLYFDARNNAELIAAFDKIAEKLAELAIVK